MRYADRATYRPRSWVARVCVSGLHSSSLRVILREVTTKRKLITEPVVPISLRVTPAQHEALKDLASRNTRTVSQEMRVAIDAHLRSAA